MIAIKKIGAFIASRALYFMLGLLIAVGATYVYATWEQAKTTTTNPGELSEANWNELVTMIESEIGGGCYVSYIDDPTDAACVAGFTNMGSAGSWGYCRWASVSTSRAYLRPPGGGCGAGWTTITTDTAFVCCQ